MRCAFQWALSSSQGTTCKRITFMPLLPHSIMTPWLSCSTKSSKITNPQPWNWTLWWHLMLTHPLNVSPTKGNPYHSPAGGYPHSCPPCMCSQYTCPDMLSDLQPSFHKPLPRVLHTFDSCIMGPTTQFNWPCLNLTGWYIYSQRKMRPATGLGAQPFIRNTITL